MCGIAGALSADHRRDVRPLVDRMTSALAHRGPDGEGFRWIREPSAAFGHRRLSIVDLACGAQPMANEDGRIWVVLNGELYNHVELRDELERGGHVFRTRADTEVLVHGWEEWGVGVLRRLNGMYAFALFDGRGDGPGTCWLARDPIGVKPLYVGVSEDTWWFASELAAPKAGGVLSPELKQEALAQYLVYRFIPSPATPFRNCWKMPPGHILRLPLGALPQEPKFEPFSFNGGHSESPRTAMEWEEAIRTGLRSAVRRQLMSDIPIGSLLSGGVDSTVVTSFMRDDLPEPPLSFAIGLGESGHLDELPPARRAAGALDVPLVEVGVSDAEFLAAWPNQIRSMGEPIANSGTLLVGLLCQRVREFRKVVLSGQGADEPLGGYPRHWGARLAGVARHLRPLLAILPESLASSDRLSRMRRVASAEGEARTFTELLAVFGPTEASELFRKSVDPDALVAPVQRCLAGSLGGDFLNRFLRVDAQLSLADDLLVVADHMSMRSSVEMRVPFLDLEFFGLIERMPSRYKVSAFGERKVMYRRAVRRVLPTQLQKPLLGWKARTGRKLGFTTPLDKWFRVWVNTDAEAFLLGGNACVPAYLDGDRIQTLLNDVRAGRQARERQLLSFYVLEHWLRHTLGVA